MKQMIQLFEQKETEENWTKFQDSIQKFQLITLGSHHLDQFIVQVKKLKNALISCVLTFN
jgi:hypothetical protein